MDEQDLFTVRVFQVSKAGRNDNQDHEDNPSNGCSNNEASRDIDEYQNMMSARVIKGRMLELEHSNLAGPLVKFKTVVNYEKTLDTGSYLGISFQPQESYISKLDD